MFGTLKDDPEGAPHGDHHEEDNWTPATSVIRAGVVRRVIPKADRIIGLGLRSKCFFELGKETTPRMTFILRYINPPSPGMRDRKNRKLQSDDPN